MLNLVSQINQVILKTSNHIHNEFSEARHEYTSHQNMLSTLWSYSKSGLGLRESMANLNPNLTKLPNEKHIQQFSCKNCIILLWHVMGCDF